jgi:predicted DNA binding CopG/RHH family protein
MNKFKSKTFQPVDEEERELMESIENEEWRPVPDFAKEKANAVQAAKNTLNRDKRINLRLSQ